MGELADTLHCDASYITGITNRLEDQGLVERRVDASDRRIKHLVVTSKGKQLREAMRVRAEEALPATSGLDVEQRQTLRDLLRVANQSQSGQERPVDIDRSC